MVRMNVNNLQLLANIYVCMYVVAFLLMLIYTHANIHKLQAAVSSNANQPALGAL